MSKVNIPEYRLLTFLSGMLSVIELTLVVGGLGIIVVSFFMMPLSQSAAISGLSLCIPAIITGTFLASIGEGLIVLRDMAKNSFLGRKNE